MMTQSVCDTEAKLNHLEPTHQKISQRASILFEMSKRHTKKIPDLSVRSLASDSHAVLYQVGADGRDLIWSDADGEEIILCLLVDSRVRAEGTECIQQRGEYV